MTLEQPKEVHPKELAPSVWVERDCPICGTQTQSSLFAESNVRAEELDHFAFASRKLPEYMHARLLACASCDMLYASPALDGKVLADCYKDADFDSGLESGYAARTYARELRPLLATLPRPLSGLDIGCGDGTFLEQLVSAGFNEVVGIEPSIIPIQAAKPVIRDNIRCGLFAAGDYAPASFSLITCFQVMEHVPDPLSLCEGVLKLLQPGGAFAIIVHNRRALSAKILGKKSPIFDIEHLQLFSADSGTRLLESAGFTDVTVTSIWNRYPLHYWMKLFPLPRAMKLPLIGLSRKLLLGNIAVSIPAGNLLFTGIRP